MLDIITSLRTANLQGLFGTPQISHTNPNLIQTLVGALTDRNEAVRHNSAMALITLAENQPDILYPYWGQIEPLLDSHDSSQKMAALQIIAALTAVDELQYFERIFHKYFKILVDDNVTTARAVARCAGTIVLHNPLLEPQITQRLLAIHESLQPRSHKEAVNEEIIRSFSKYYLQATDAEMLLSFARHNLQSASPATRRAAQDFIEEFDPL